LLHRQPGQLLESFQTVREALQLSLGLLRHDAHHGAAGFDVEINIAVVIHQVEQPFEIVTGSVALPDQSSRCGGG